MLVVSDSSPLNFLIRLDHVEVLPNLFERVLVPPQVEAELTRPTTPVEVQRFMAVKPAWLEVRAPSRIEPIASLDTGEEAAISLAREVKAELILLDDGPARKAAALHGLVAIGLIGILERAHERGLLSLPDVVARLPSEYRIDRSIIAAALARHRRPG